MTDSDYMRLALKLAIKGKGRVNPNPMVGAIIVKNGKIIGKGFHQTYGDLHAERNAFADCKARGEDAEGATIYVTLEPCCHYGNTPPCTDAIIENKISRVVIGSSDPNPKVAGKGVKKLREHGIEVTEGILQPECDEINSVFFHYITTGLPYVVMKYAMTLDGKTAAYTGKSQWITGETARRSVHETRGALSAIMTGVGTVIADNPMLTCRIPGGKNPVRIICDTKLRTPLDSNVVNTTSEAKTIIATSVCDKRRHQPYIQKGCEIVVVPEYNGHVDLCVLMKELGSRKIDSVLLEGGAELNWSAINCGIVNRVQAYIAPKLFGGKTAKSPMGGAGVESPDGAFIITSPKIQVIGDDILIEGVVKFCSQE